MFPPEAVGPKTLAAAADPATAKRAANNLARRETFDIMIPAFSATESGFVGIVCGIGSSPLRRLRVYMAVDELCLRP